jgi:hypothetical protein
MIKSPTLAFSSETLRKEWEINYCSKVLNCKEPNVKHLASSTHSQPDGAASQIK